MSQTISETTGQLHISNEVPALLERIDEITPMLMPRPKRMRHLAVSPTLQHSLCTMLAFSGSASPPRSSAVMKRHRGKSSKSSKS